MSTRKIEGFAYHDGWNTYGENTLYRDASGLDNEPGEVPATLIIGGKGWTEEEVEADRQRTREVVQRLVDVMRLIHPSCMVLHHEPSEKHAGHEACPVKARFYNVLNLAKSRLQIEPTNPEQR